MWARRSSKFRRFPTRRRMSRRGRAAEVSNYATGFNLTAYSGSEGSTEATPAIWTTAVMSLSSLVTDFATVGAGDNVRSIPPQYRGVSISRVSLDVDVCVTGAPSAGTMALYNPVIGQVSTPWARCCLMLYQDDFVWDSGTGLEEPNIDVLHPWQDDLIPGAVHAEFNRPKRILMRHHFALPATVPVNFTMDDTGTYKLWNVDYSQHHARVRMSAKKVFINERQCLWLALCATNPFAVANHDIYFGVIAAGPVVYKLRTA